MIERNIHPDLKTALVNNEPFNYCHLVKFERPSLPDSVSGKVSTSKERYTYITDASRDVLFNDGSTSLSGVPNGEQLYVANKLINVGSITEGVEASATTFSIDLDGTSLGAYAQGTCSISIAATDTYDIKFSSSISLSGFTEGDKITITGNSTPGDYNIVAFRANNVLRVSKIDTDMAAQNNVEIALSLSSEEIKSILLDKTQEGYASFLNREVFVWKAYFNSDGSVIGAPVLIFKGLISNVSFDDNETNIKVTWGMTSHWGDWSQVSGRITSDDFHRAIDSNGNPTPASTIKPAYAYDKGFSHAETSVNLLAKYTTLVEKQDVSVKKKFFGLISKVKVKKYLAEEQRSTELDFQLQAKAIPVIYGVRPVSGIPIFADTLVSDPSTVYVVYALTEGEANSIYDVYIDNNSLICGNKADFDTRSQQNSDNTVPLVCMGRADRGDVLGGVVAVSGTPTSYYYDESYLYDLGYNLIDQRKFRPYVEPTEIPAVTSSGIVDGQTITLSSPQKITIDFFSGKEGQQAAQSLVNIAKNNGFKIQNDYWTGTDTAEYWGPNHKLLDTAYVVVKYKIAEGETSIPDLQFILNGKVIPCYNYDYSYSHDIKATSENADNFKLGQFVTLKNSSGAIINSSVQIIDKWFVYKPDGTKDTRFRFSSPPALNYIEGVPTITKFYMEADGQTWTMITFNHNENQGNPRSAIKSIISGVSSSSGALQLTYSSNPLMGVGGDPIDENPKFSVLKLNGDLVLNEKFGDAIISGNSSSTSVTTEINYNTSASLASGIINENLVSRNTIALANSASSTDGYYVGYNITLTKVDSSGRLKLQTKEIVAYDGTNKVATIAGLWDIDGIPDTADTYKIIQSYSDSRTTTNFALIALDYITSKYGRGLDIENIDLPSWLESGRKCDIQSNVTIRLTNPSSTIAAGAVYKHTNAAGDILWQGTVLEAFNSSIPGSNTKFVTFTNVVGKLSSQWNNWKVFREGEYVYSGNRLYKVASGYVATTNAPTHISGTVNYLEYMGTATITKVSGIGGSTESIYTSGNPVQGIKNNRLASGYSLYDSDGVDYWKYIGWSSQDQRFVTKHQGNLAIDTSQPVFENINSILSHFGGMLRYSGGKYYLDVEELAGEITDSSSYYITEDDIIGKISLVDQGIRNAYNSLAVSYADPSNKFEARNISFFNSDYLKADRNVPRKGNLSIPGVTNYYNARLLADTYLNRSRYGLEIAFTVRPRGITLIPGQVISIKYDKYGWSTPKKFRIKTLTIAEDCLIDITAEEYDDSLYQISNVKKQAGSGLTGLPTVTSVSPPLNLSATELEDFDDTVVSINLTWNNSPSASPTNSKTEIYHYSKQFKVTTISSNLITTAAPHGLAIDDILVSFATGNGLIAGTTYIVASTPGINTLTLKTVSGLPVTLSNGSGLSIWLGKHLLLTTLDIPVSKFVDLVYSEASVSKYYRIRHKVASVNLNGVSTDNYSTFTPELSSPAVLGSTEGAPELVTGYLTNESVTLAASAAGVVDSYSTATGIFKIIEGITEVTSGVTFSTISSVNCTGTIDSSGTYSVSSMSADTASITLRAAYKGVSIDKVFSLAKAKAGTNGTSGTIGQDAVTVLLSNEAFTVYAYAEGSVPNWAGAEGNIKVFAGPTDVTDSASFSVSLSSGVSGTVNTATNSPVSGQPKGYYRMTGMAGDSGTMTFTIVYNSVSYTRIFSVSKVKTGYEISSSLPSTNLFVGRMVFLTTDEKLYRYTATGWTTAVPALDISGQLASAQIASLAASKVTGQLTDSQIAAISAAKLTGQITNTQISNNAIKAPNIEAGAITAGKLDTNSVTASNIAAGAVVAGKLDAGAVVAGNVAAGAIQVGNLAANSVIADNIQSNAITSAKIFSGAITTDKLEAGAVTAAKISVTQLSALSANLGTITAGLLQNGSGTNYFDLNNSRLQFTSGSYVLRQGSSMGASGDLIMWYGPSWVAHWGMTKTNGVFALGTDGKGYYGTAELNSGGGGGFSITPSTPYATGYSNGVGTATSELVSMSATGASGGVTYLWTYLSGSTGMTCNNPNSSSTTFSGYLGSLGASMDTFWSVRGTDSTGKTSLATVRVVLQETS